MESVLQKEKVIIPEYGGRSIVNVAASILQCFGVTPPTPPLHETILPLGRFRSFDKVVLIIFDSLGYHRFRSTSGSRRFRIAPLTTVFPSTTSSALSSLYTAVPPAIHGMLGFRLFLKEYGFIVNMIKLSPAGFHERDRLLETGFNPTRFLPVKTVFQLLKKRGIKSYAFTKMHYYKSSLSLLMHKGAETLPYINPVDLFLQIGRVLKESRGKVFITAYIDDFDTIAHYYGTGTEEEQRTIVLFFHILKKVLLKETYRKTLMLLTSDHGQVPSPPTGKVDSSKLSWLSRFLAMPPTGEFRASYLHMKPGCGEACMHSLKERLSEGFIVLTREEAIDLELFGDTAMSRRHAERVGDIILISKGEKFLHYPYSDFELRARHGGLNRNEMLVPLINLTE